MLTDRVNCSYLKKLQVSLTGDFDVWCPPQTNFISIWHPTVVMSNWLVGGRWLGFEFQDGHIFFFSMAQWGAMCYPLPPRLSFPLIILSLLLSAQSPLTSPFSDLLSPLYPPLPNLFFFFNSTSYFQVQNCVCVCVQPLSTESENWQVACVWIGRISLYVKQPVSVHEDHSVMSFSSTGGFCSPLYGWI